jgi:hypothetical protein
VKRALPFFAGLVAAIVVVAATGAQAGTPQTLGFFLHDTGAATERQPRYHSSAPIAINVAGDTARHSVLTVTAHGPDGSEVTAPLVRAGATFSGALELPAAGRWDVALSARLGSVTAALADVPLQVVSDDSAEVAGRWAFALAALLIGAGSMVLVRARRGASPSTNGYET